MNNIDELDEILDLFGHAVINYGQTEGSRTKLKAKAKKRINALIQSYKEKWELEAREDELELHHKWAWKMGEGNHYEKRRAELNRLKEGK